MDTFETYRPLLFSIAYRMLGSAMEAEDIVQEAYLRYQSVAAGGVQSPKAFLSTVVTRLCLDHLKSAQTQRESYYGPWLPEPVLTNTDSAEPEAAAGNYETISMAFLVLLESLTPVERAVFLLREVFDYEYAEIAGIVGKDETTCRQLFSRAKKHIAEHRPRFHSSPEVHANMLGRFMLACQSGDLDGLMNLLAEDVTSWADAGGKTKAATRPIYGRSNVARYFAALSAKMTPDMTAEAAEINGQLGLIVRLNSKPFFVLTLDTGEDGFIHAFRVVMNPDKIGHL